MGSVLTLNIINGTAVLVFCLLSAGALGYLIVRRMTRNQGRAREAMPEHPTRRWLVTVLAGAGAGALAAVVVLFVSEDVLNSFGLPLDSDTHAWVIGAFAAVGIAIVNLWNSRWWRKAVAVLSVPVFIATATLGINAAYGLDPTLASLLNIDVGHRLAIPQPVVSEPVGSGRSGSSALWKTWKPPVGMPTSGRFGSVQIPSTASRFSARAAYVYLPPAALVADAPPLPVLVMMMGQPGSPSSSSMFLRTLNASAAANRGLGPIVVTIDQLGSPEKNPLCVDSSAGRVYTYVTTDVVNFIRKTFHAESTPRYWAVGGYSNGGECALSFGAKRPDLFGSILDISGQIAPSLGPASTTLRVGFNGKTAAFEAEKPLNILKKHHYTNTLAIFTSGSKDAKYTGQGAVAEAAAKAAGMSTARFIGPGVGHRADAVQFGFPKGLPLLYLRWGLQAPNG